MTPIFPVAFSANHTRPSPPVAIPCSEADGLRPDEYSLIVPLGVILPIAFAPVSVKSAFPSAPAAMPSGELPNGRPEENSVTVPLVLIRPTCAQQAVLGEPEVAVGS